LCDERSPFRGFWRLCVSIDSGNVSIEVYCEIRQSHTEVILNTGGGGLNTGGVEYSPNITLTGTFFWIGYMDIAVQLVAFNKVWCLGCSSA
jgi:hypothetical protein